MVLSSSLNIQFAWEFTSLELVPHLLQPGTEIYLIGIIIVINLYTESHSNEVEGEINLVILTNLLTNIKCKATCFVQPVAIRSHIFT